VNSDPGWSFILLASEDGAAGAVFLCLLLVIKIKTCTYQLCKQHSADTNVLPGNWWIPIIGKTADNWPILIMLA